MNEARIVGVGDTAFGRLEGRDTLDLMSQAAERALADAGLARDAVDGVVTGYSTAMPHLMLSTLFAEHFGVTPAYAHAVQLGGATGAAITMLAKLLVESGQYRNVLVVAGENRLSNPGGRDSAIHVLAQVGHAEFEVPYGATIPGYYALLASQYMHAHGLSQEDLAEFAVFMRAHAARHPGAHLTEHMTVADVMASRAIATPLKLLDCCPISDGGVAFVVSGERGSDAGPRIAGAGQAHRHQHISVARDLGAFGAADAATRAFREAGIRLEEIEILGVYDSFTITIAILLEEIGFSTRGRSVADIRDRRYATAGGIPLNTHGGLLSFGHSGVAGGMAHIAEVVRQMRGQAGERQMPNPADKAFVHGDGGVLSSHVSLILAAE